MEGCNQPSPLQCNNWSNSLAHSEFRTTLNSVLLINRLTATASYDRFVNINRLHRISMRADQQENIGDLVRSAPLSPWEMLTLMPAPGLCPAVLLLVGRLAKGMESSWSGPERSITFTSS